MKPMRIVFMGTPDFAVASLQALLAANYAVVAVVTAPDKPAGRGQKLQQSAVKVYAEAQGLPVLQPVRLKDPAFIEQLRALKADLQVVVAFRMLPEIVWNMPPKGTINLHASLLPQYRGAAPINHAIIQGEVESGVTTFFLQHEIDTGNILMAERVPILSDDTAGDLHDTLMRVGADLLVQTVRAIESGNYTEKQQQLPEDGILKHAPKIFKEDAKIDWNQPAQKIQNLIRGLSPYPAAYTELDGKLLKIYKSSLERINPQNPPGTLQTDHKTFLKFAAQDGYIHILDMQLQGKKRLSVAEFLRGYRV